MFGRYYGEEPPHPERAAIGGQAFQVLLDSIKAGQASGAVRSGDPIQLAWVAWSLVHGLAMLLIDRRLPLSQPEEIESLVQFATHTLSSGLAERSL
jgi:hypothetical protein